MVANVPATSQSSSSETASERRMESHGSRHILIADPDDRVLAKLREACESAGYAVTTVMAAPALLDAVRHIATHVIAVSMDLPNTTPAELIEQIHAGGAAPPIVLIAERGADPRQGALRQAATACVFKPVDAPRFVGVCERILRLSDQRLSEGDWRSERRRSLHAEVSVDVDASLLLQATLVNLSARGFRIELPQAVGMGRLVRVAVRASESAPGLTFEGRVLWEKPLPAGTLAGGDLVELSPENERTLAALLRPAV
jgi:CheY-like chemotaxis protein